MSSFINRYKKSLELRPLLWIAPVAIAGSGLGPTWSSHLLLHRYITRAFSPFWIFWGIVILAVGLAIWCRYQKYFWGARSALIIAIFIGFFGYSAWRTLPPPDDLSRLIWRSEQIAYSTPTKLQSVPLRLRGYVASPPHVTDYEQEFSLKSTFVVSEKKVLSLHGNIWVHAPLNWQIKTGDFIEIHAPLRDLPRVGNAAEPDHSWRYLLHDSWCMIKLRDSDSWKILPHTTPENYRLEAFLNHFRQKLLHLYQRRYLAYNIAYPRSSAQLMVGMVYGNGALSTPLPKLVRDNFRAAGLSHLLVASGTHMSLFMALILFFLNLIGMRRFPWLMLIILIFFLAFYALLTGGAASIWRAFLAGACIAIALLWGRPIDTLSLWCLAATVLLAIDPRQIFNLSFQLTFAATWGMIVVAPPLLRSLKKHIKSTFIAGLSNIGIYTLAAQLAVLPFIAYHFGQISWAGAVTNFAGIPLAGFLVGSGVLSVFVPWFTWPNAFLTHFMFDLAARANTWDFLQWRGLSFSFTGIVLYLLLLSILPRWEEIRLIAQDEWHHFTRRFRTNPPTIPSLRVSIWGVTAVAILWSGAILLQRPAPLQVTFLDVGQGDSIFIQTPAGHNFLIDGGTISNTEHGKVGNSVIIPYLQAHGVRQLDAILLSHADADHCNALDEVLDEIPVKMFLDGSGDLLPSGQTKEANLQAADYWILRDKIKKLHILRHLAQAGQNIQLDDGVTLQILAPMRPALPNENNHSMVVKLIYGKTSFLFTGDMEKEEEMQLIRRGANVQCTILKVAHHGSATSSTSEFLRTSHPAAAVISSGRYNPFGHPALSTLENLKKSEIPLYRTDLNGTVEVKSDGKKCYVKTFR